MAIWILENVLIPSRQLNGNFEFFGLHIFYIADYLEYWPTGVIGVLDLELKEGSSLLIIWIW